MAAPSDPLRLQRPPEFEDWKLIFSADGLPIPADSDDLFIQLHKRHRTQTAATAEPIDMFSKGLMQKQEAVPKQRCWDVYGHRRKVHQSWKSPPVPDVQPAHQTAEPAASSHFRNITLSPAAHSSLLSSLTHTNKNKMSQMSAAWRDGV